MNTKEAFEDPRIVMLEEIILDEYEHGKQVEAESIIKNALHHRWMILRELMQYDEESKRLLSDFNDRIKTAAIALFNKTKAIYEGMMKLYDGIGDLEVEGKLKLGYTYPKTHPVQTERAETMWEVMTQGGYDRMYSTDGCSWSLKWDQNGNMTTHESLEAWLGMADENDNWNEGLDYEWSKDMHLVYPFHNLYDNRHFSLYDLVYVSEFEFEICIRLDGILYFCQE